MRSYKIKPSSDHPHKNIRLDVPHQESIESVDGRKGDIMIDVLHNNGIKTDLPFYYHQIEEVK
jgi:hypothetical protein